MSAIDRDTVRRLLGLAPGAAEYKFLFDQLDSPAWLQPLREEGVFNHPPNSVLEGDRRVFLLWSPSRYLARIAERAPSDVAKVIRSIPETDNFRVHDDLLAATNAMPPEIAIGLTDEICRWLMGPNAGAISRDAAEVMGRFATAGFGPQALQIAKRALRLSTPTGPHEEFAIRDAQPICSQYDYAWILESKWPNVVAAAPHQSWGFIRRLLEVAVDANRTPEAAPHDLSYIWRRTIEPSRQTIPYELKGLLVEAVYRTGKQLVTSGTSDVLGVYGDLEQEKWDIFMRIALQLLIDLSDCSSTSDALGSKANFEHLCLQHEYMALMRRCFGAVPETQRLAILGWIDQGPDLERIAGLYQERTGEPPAEEYLEQRKAIWQRDRLAPIADALNDPWRTKYEDLAKRFGEGEREPMPARIEIMHGSTSPLSADAIRAMGAAECAEFLKEWSPTAGPNEPSPEGLAVQLGHEIENRPSEFAGQLALFEGVWPIYARTIASSLRNAIGQGRVFPPEPVLGWCEWLVGVESGTQAGHHTDDDPTWTWARLELAHLLGDWLKAGPVTLPVESRERVWRLLEALLDDQDPNESTVSDDPAIQAWNSVRGTALMATIEYGAWVQRSTPETEFAGMATLPELAAGLEAHLKPEVDPSPAVRSVYGQRFPNLASLDTEWTRAIVGEIFPWANQPQLAQVAWQSYLDWWLPGQPSFDLLRASYERAVEQVTNADGTFEQMVPAEARLAEHLMVLTLYGELALSQTEGLLAAWYQRAGDRLCAHCIEFLGRYLSRTSVLHPDLQSRVTQLWDLRTQVVERDSRNHHLELTAYGWLFAVPALSREWRLRHLLRVLELGTNIASSYFVLEQLVDDVQQAPADSARAVRLLVSQLAEPDMWRGSDQVRAVIASAKGSGSDAAPNEARQAAEQLLRLGLEEFRDLA